MKRFDAAASLKRLEQWCAEQKQSKVKLVRGKPMTAAQLDAIPTFPETYPYELSVPYEPKRFIVPESYRSLLSLAGGLHVEFDGERGRETWNVVHLYRPGPCSNAQRGQRFTLCDSWAPEGTTVDDRAISTTELISFANAGFDTEASRWCFFTGAKGEPSVLLEDNDYECLTGRYVDTGEWLSDGGPAPAAKNFAAWFTKLVDVVTSRAFDPENNDALVNAQLAK